MAFWAAAFRSSGCEPTSSLFSLLQCFTVDWLYKDITFIHSESIFLKKCFDHFKMFKISLHESENSPHVHRSAACHVYSTFNLPSQAVYLSHQQLLLVLQDLKLGVVQIQLGLVELQLQLVHRVLRLVDRRRRRRIGSVASDSVGQAAQLHHNDKNMSGKGSDLWPTNNDFLCKLLCLLFPQVTDQLFGKCCKILISVSQSWTTWRPHMFCFDSSPKIFSLLPQRKDRQKCSHLRCWNQRILTFSSR